MKKIIALISMLGLLLSVFAFTACDANMGKFYVNFDKQDGSPVTTQSQWVRLNESRPVNEPDDPISEGYIFKGWYKEPTCKNRWNFVNDKLKSGDNITLYAKFVANESPVVSSSFYRLQEAYDLELLSYDDLFEASFYHNGDWNGVPYGMIVSRAAHQKNPEFLSTETENKIKQAFLDEYYANFGGCIVFDDYKAADVLEHTLDDIAITNYCGTYNDATIVMLDGLYGYDEGFASETVEGITFYYNNGNYLRVWVEEHEAPVSRYGLPDVKYIKTNYTYDETKHIDPIVIDSKKDLNDYYEFFIAKNNNYGGNTEFAQAIVEYDDDFFLDSFLVFIVMIEGSGSIRHAVTKLYYHPDINYIYIDRLCPEIGTDDMAEWHIFVPISRDDCLNKTFFASVSNVAKPSITTCDGYTQIILPSEALWSSVHDGWIYFNSGSSFYRMRLDGTGYARIGDSDLLDIFDTSNYHDGWFYFRDTFGTIWGTPNHKLYRMRPDGTGFKVYNNVEYLQDFVVYGNRIFYTTAKEGWSNAKLYSMNLNGSDVRELATGMYSFIVSDNYIFYNEELVHEPFNYKSTLIRLNLDGTGKQLMVERDSSIRPILVKNGVLFYYSFGHSTQSIYSIDINGNDDTLILENTGLVRIVDLQDNYLYFTWGRTAQSSYDHVVTLFIYCLETGETKQLRENLWSVYYQLLGDNIYFTDITPDFQRLYRIHSDGGAPQLVFDTPQGYDYGMHFIYEGTLYITMRPRFVYS